MLCEIPKGSDVFYGISTFFLWHKHLIFYGKHAEAFKLLRIAPEFISDPKWFIFQGFELIDVCISLLLKNL